MINFLINDILKSIFDYSKLSVKSQNLEKDNVIFRDYIFDIGNKFISRGWDTRTNINKTFETIDMINYDETNNI